MVISEKTSSTITEVSSVADSVSPLAEFDDDDQLDTFSLTSSVTDYPVYWGRRYHRFKQGSYHFPNDQDESDRLDTQHAIFTCVLNGRLFNAPLDPETTYNVLDIGTGTGTWAIELADSNLLPNSTITGTDLSAIQPEEVPENVIFEIQDCTESDWDRPLGSVDFIHTRAMTGSFVSYRSFLKQARKYLKPGTGWIECHEVHSRPMTDDGTIPKDWKFSEWEQDLYDASIDLSPPRPIRIASKLKHWMESCGYIDVTEHIFKIPIGPWAKNVNFKQIGAHWRQNLMKVLPAVSYKLFAEAFHMTHDEVEVEFIEIRKALQMKEVHSYMRFFTVYGRRPSAEEETRLK